MPHKNSNEKVCSNKKSKTPKNIDYYIDYTSAPIPPNNIIIYSVPGIDFIAFRYRRDILDNKNNIIGDSYYDIKCNQIILYNTTSGIINATYTAVQTFTYKNKNYVVYVQGKINFTLEGNPIDPTNPQNFIVNSQIENLVTTNVFVNSSIFTNVQVKFGIVHNSIINKYSLKFDNAVKTT